MLGGLALGFVAGCSSTVDTIGQGLRESPTGRLIRGEIALDEYDDALTEANVEAREREQFEVNRQTTRAYNTATGQVEYVPEDTQQVWNEEMQRWEFTPATQPRVDEDNPPPATNAR